MSGQCYTTTNRRVRADEITMQIEVTEVGVEEIHPLRELHRQAMNCQIIHDSLHRRGFTQSYLVRVGARVAGYGAITSGEDRHRVFPRGIVKEFYLLPEYRGDAVPLFGEFVRTSHATRICAQSNDPLLSLMLYDFAEGITSDVIIFHDFLTSHLTLPDGVFLPGVPANGKDGEWVIEVSGEVVAWGGFTTHYNPPYGDIYMATAEPHRRRGYASFLIQQLKRVCYEAGRRPAARCNAGNLGSRKALENAGLFPCGRLLEGAIRDARIETP